MSVLQALQSDTWYSFERFCRLICGLGRDPLSQGAAAVLPLPQGGSVERAKGAPWDMWMATYGRVLAALFQGPARWLGFVEVDEKGDDLIAIQALSAVPPGDLTSIPHDALRFVGSDRLIVSKSWRATRFRPVLSRIAREVAADQTSATYQLDPASFRAFVDAGGAAEEPIRELAANGFPLPSVMADRVKQWETRHGRYQLYDSLAVIELAEDVAQAEIEAIARLLGSRLYEVAPRCLLVLNRDQAPAIVEELQRRGYTPRITS
jgi:hypothetical protein